MRLRLNNVPVSHIVYDSFLPQEQVEQCAAEISCNRGQWVKYNNDAEKKTTCNDPDAFGVVTRSILDGMQSRKYCEYLQIVFGIKPLQSDPLLHGGGIHISGAGGILNIHLDYARHPRLPLLERRLNAILYLSPEWKEEWGGATVLTAPDGYTVLSRVYPRPGRLLVFETNDLSYHGVEPVTCPEGTERITLATYYLSICRETTTRERALFVPKRT